MFKTKIYKECYPFCREVLYNSQKKELFIKLIRRRKIDLLYMDKEALKYRKKVRQYMQEKIKEEKGLIDELQKNMQNRNFQNIDYDYPNWLIDHYRTLFSEWTATLHFYYNTNNSEWEKC